MTDSLLPRLVHPLQFFDLLEQLLHTSAIFISSRFLLLVQALPEQDDEDAEEDKDVAEHGEIARQRLDIAQLHNEACDKGVEG